MSDSAFGFGGISSHSNTESQDEHHISLVNRTVKWSNPVRTKWCRFSSLPASQTSHTNDAMLYLGNEHMQIAAKTQGTPLSNQHCHLDNFMTADGCPPVAQEDSNPCVWWSLETCCLWGVITDFMKKSQLTTVMTISNINKNMWNSLKTFHIRCILWLPRKH